MKDIVKLIADRLRDRYKAREVILFGSHAIGGETQDSDIDILVISESKERYFERQASVRRVLRGLKNKIPVAPIVLTPDEVAEKKKQGDQFIEEILTTGIRV